ncbi:MAG TPA: hypothetical protein VJ553_03310, partial [Candidatus Paceibacterota bacterium]|nr:hypothetical protein [Candidatus Paceibacterota bacterium]
LLKTAYEKTDAGKAASLKANIAYWEASLRVDKTNADEITAILADLRAQYEKLGGSIVDLGYLADWELEHMADTWKTTGAGVVTTVEGILFEIYDRVALFGGATSVTLEGLTETFKKHFKEIADDAKKVADTWEETFAKVVGTVQSAMGTLGGITSQYYTNQNNALDTWYQKQIAALGDMTDATQEQTDAKKKIDQEYHDQQVALKKKEWESNKAMSIANATVSGIEAVVKTFAAYAWPWNLIPAGIMTALAAVQVGMIASMPEPAFAQGADFTVPPGYDNDSYPMRVESGEHVTVTPAGQGGGDMIHNTLILDGTVLADWITRASRNKKILTTARSVVP